MVTQSIGYLCDKWALYPESLPFLHTLCLYVLYTIFIILYIFIDTIGMVTLYSYRSALWGNLPSFPSDIAAISLTCVVHYVLGNVPLNLSFILLLGKLGATVVILFLFFSFFLFYTMDNNKAPFCCNSLYLFMVFYLSVVHLEWNLYIVACDVATIRHSQFR